MKKGILILLAAMLLAACGKTMETEQEAVYMNITAQEARSMRAAGARPGPGAVLTPLAKEILEETQ